MTVNFTVSYGWWLVPLFITILSFLFAFIKSDRSYAHGLGTIGKSMYNLFIVMIALLVSLSSWFVWSLLT